MNHISKQIKKGIRFAQANYILTAFLFIILFVGIIILFKVVTGEKETLYVKVKVSQGLWWASTQRPAIWIADSLKKGDQELTLSGEPRATIMEVRSYPIGVPNLGSEQYEIFLTTKLETNFNEKQKSYIYNRAPIAVGVPIDFEFESVHISGTVTDFSASPFKTEYTEKTIDIVKYWAYPSEFDAVEVGDTYFDGEDTVIEILSKRYDPAYEQYSGLGNNYAIETEKRINLFVTARIKVQPKKGLYVFREDFPIQVGKKISFQTPSYYFDQFTINSIQ